MALHPHQTPSTPDKPSTPERPTTPEPLITQARTMSRQAEFHGNFLPTEPGNLSMVELALWWDRTLTGSSAGMPNNPDQPQTTSGGQGQPKG